MLRCRDLVASSLKLFVVLRLAQNFSYYGLSKLLGGLLTIGCRPASFCMTKSDLAWKAMSVRPLDGSLPCSFAK